MDNETILQRLSLGLLWENKTHRPKSSAECCETKTGQSQRTHAIQSTNQNTEQMRVGKMFAGAFRLVSILL